MVVDDEDMVRALVCEILRLQGYHVLEACSGEEAMELSQRRCDPIDVLVTDIMMPGIGGLELSARVTDERPEIKTVLMSGTVHMVADALRTRRQPLEFLHKPFAPDELLAIVQRASRADIGSRDCA